MNSKFDQKEKCNASIKRFELVVHLAFLIY